MPVLVGLWEHSVDTCISGGTISWFSLSLEKKKLSPAHQIKLPKAKSLITTACDVLGPGPSLDIIATWYLKKGQGPKHHKWLNFSLLGAWSGAGFYFCFWYFALSSTQSTIFACFSSKPLHYCTKKDLWTWESFLAILHCRTTPSHRSLLCTHIQNLGAAHGLLLMHKKKVVCTHPGKCRKKWTDCIKIG